jgi:PKD repeat protein
MTTGATGPPTFEYGTLKDAGVPAVFVISESRVGDALPGSGFTSDGTIMIIVPKSAFGNPHSGDLLGAIGGRTLTGDTPQTNKLERSNVFIDHTFVKAQTDNSYPAATYTVVGDAANHPPVAVLVATPTNGFAPLTVNFNGAGSSDPDSCDSVVSYTFDFGDGTTPVTQPAPTISHIYNATGSYTAKLTVSDSYGAQNTNVASLNIQVSAPPPQCLEDDDSRIAYSNGWHLINYASASGGHFRYHSGNSPQHFANLDFTVPAGSTGSISYAFAKSPKGGTADIYLDGVLKQTVSYAGSVGSTQAPEFKPEYNVQYGNLAAGAHKLEIKNLTGVVYVDRFCLTNSNSNAQPASGPGNTTNQPGTASTGQTSSTNYQMPSGSQEISVVAEASLNVPFKLALVNPSGLTLQTVDAVNGTAVLNATVSQSGVYVIKVINVSLGPLQFTTTATPLVTR